MIMTRAWMGWCVRPHTEAVADAGGAPSLSSRPVRLFSKSFGVLIGRGLQIGGLLRGLVRLLAPIAGSLNRAASSRGVSGRIGARSPAWWKCEAARRSSTRAICRASCLRSAAVSVATNSSALSRCRVNAT